MFENDEFVCRHMQLTKGDIVRVIREKELTSFSEIQDETDAGTICGTCVADIEEILEEELERRKSGGN
ncbi:(2Fe-2S)-binding protein [Natronoflexus pectinivorans]|uniref:BFD-like [2Fe-2S] binding protein n=1 Tax=Natronoflexus pectinivorans TaxID=682526 RepID=A0A4R2GKP2_9BACT|nr:(2Fe-2S)-binding protein [Natronoflexus pectinivorans]TCO09362.1 BFD-like [2Fe-2S] binding protein [Natronoflexus pectinivorans]